MNKKICVIAMVFLIFGFLNFTNADTIESTISTDAVVNSQMPPDTAKIRFYIETSGQNAADVKSKNDKTSNALINAIKSKLSQDESIKTVSYNLRDVYSYKAGVKTFQKYEVTNGFEVKLKDLDKISDIIKTAADMGATRINNVSFSLENSENICNDLMAKAISQAKSQAEHLSKASGAQLLKIKTVKPYCTLNSSFTPKLYSNATLSASGDSAEASDVIEPGEINIKAGANMIYYLK